MYELTIRKAISTNNAKNALCILCNLIETLHWINTLTFLAHLRLILYRTIETDVKSLTVLHNLQFLLIDLPLEVVEAQWLTDRVFWHVAQPIVQTNETVC